MGDTDGPNIVDQVLDLPGWITDLQIDLTHSTITYRVWVEFEQKTYTIVFSGVSSFFFSRGKSTLRFKEPWRQLINGSVAVSEWTSAGYYPNGVGVVRIQAEPGSIDNEWLGPFRTTPNFAIEQLAGTFFIEASQVHVDDRVFEVGYPPDTSPPSNSSFGTYSDEPENDDVE